MERAKTEQALRASEEKFRGFIETAGEGIVECDAEGRIVFVNQQTVDMLGYTQNELLGRLSWDYVTEDQVEQSRADRKRLIAGHNIAREYKLRHKDGSLVWTQCNITPIYDARGQYRGSLTMHADISERKQMEEDKQLLLNAVLMERDCLSGTGLGLAVCYSIAARHHARLDYDTGPEGTIFYLRFPNASG